MRQSKLFTKSLRSISSEETAINAQLLLRGGFAFKHAAGVYSYLPLGWRVMRRVSDIIRQEMNGIDGQEMFMPALVDRKYLEATDRFKLDVGYDAITKTDKEPGFSLGWTHEEVITAIATHYIASYKDLPFATYQIQTKFRNEPRAKSGLLRGREFMMKDLYSFHTSEEDLNDYYQKVREAYIRVFNRCGLDVFYTLAAGGDFTANTTHEFQVLADVGEDTIYYCQACMLAQNDEVATWKDGEKCSECGGVIRKGNAVEAGNIFPLGTKYSEAMNLTYTDEKGERQHVVMGSYGIGVSRLMAIIVEVYHDERGILWPQAVAPFAAHIITIPGSAKAAQAAEKLEAELTLAGIDVLYDNRDSVSAGEKFADADLIGIPVRLTLSEKSLAAGGVEVKRRGEEETRVVAQAEVLDILRAVVSE
ncbi:MAG: aminoacyl--tRNA ligase-related protein [Candidatus Spechtbacterales bacterium]